MNPVDCFLSVPIFDRLADPRLLTDLAVEAEAAGWDGFYVWDHIQYRAPVEEVTDPWTAMAAIAHATGSIRFGPMVTPLPRRRPQVLARQMVALDRLSGGRFVLGAGLGLDQSGRELSAFGEQTDDRTRGRMLDESLELLARFLSGERFTHVGEFYRAEDVCFRPTPVNGHIPIWLAARYPYQRPLRRAARHDGVVAIDLEHPDQ
ncbi:MAG TPA: LLM class flavin-dependent oxidoreductase, partial [Acidimicrobiales bacterium]|nr:LLM class flavin-dependent oxidoreductase [Acidimicrobiales bacterium]